MAAQKAGGEYPFLLVQYKRDDGEAVSDHLKNRPFSRIDRSFAAAARGFVPGDALESAINTALAVGDPLLVTGEAGTGKTQAAYYVAQKLGIEPVIHFQVKSDTTARDLLYHFDTVRYFHDAHLSTRGDDASCPSLPEKSTYVEPRPLWEAFTQAKETGLPRVLLIDEIDKAPRDFPNDLLHELDKMEFTVTETGQTISAPKDLRPIVFITSNSERRLPAPFLRRCVYHHIRFDDTIVAEAVRARKQEFIGLGDDVIDLAIKCFRKIRAKGCRKPPSTAELLVWLRVLAVDGKRHQEIDENDLASLPFLETLLKDHKDMEEMTGAKGSR